MTLTVRLDAATGFALERCCLERGVTKSLVVQESIAIYLVTRQTAPEPRKGARLDERGIDLDTASENYKAFVAAGLIGAGELGGLSVDKATVRAKAMQRIRRNEK